MKKRVILEPAVRSPKWEIIKAAVEEVAAAREASLAQAAAEKKARKNNPPSVLLRGA
jgi:hypothetical protein